MLFRLFLLCVLPFFPVVGLADVAPSAFNFIQHKPLDPIKLQSGLPAPAARLVSGNEFQFALAYANVFMGGVTANERLVLDGESSQLNLRYRHAFNRCLQVNGTASWISNTRGRFDEPLDAWHQFFGLPDAKRDEWPNNQLEYRYELAGTEQSLTAPNSGWGDVQLQLQHALGCSANGAIVRAGITVPVGSQAMYLRSGVTDAFVDVQSQLGSFGQQSRFRFGGSIGVLKRGNARVFSNQQSVVGFGALAVNFSMSTRTQLLAQLDWHTAMFDSQLRELGDLALQLTLGARYNTKNGKAWEFSFTEDAVIDTGPDIVVRLAYIHRFGTADTGGLH